MIFDYFDKVYIINLPHRKDRHKQVCKEFRDLGLPIEDDLVHLYPAFRPAEAGPFDNVGTRGCFLSHLAVLTDARDKGYERILVFEDDITFSRNFAQYFETIQDELKDSNWDIFYGGYEATESVSRFKKNVTGQLPAIDSNIPIQCSHFMGLTKTTLEMLVPYLQAMLERPPGSPDGGPMHVDGAFSWFREAHPDIVTLICADPRAYQRFSKSDISMSMFDKIGLLKVPLDIYRNMKVYISAHR